MRLFGLTNALAAFQLPVNSMLLDMLKHLFFVYIDDILIFSKSLEDHVQHVRAVLLRLLEHLLFVKAEKCEFHSSLVSFLWYMFSPGIIQMNPAKISAVLNWPVPNSTKQLQWFLGFVNFCRRFIRNYSSMAAPLNALTSVKRPLGRRRG